MNDDNTYMIKQIKLYVVLILVFIVSTLASNIVASCLISFGKIILPGGAFIFPITYFIGNIVAEIYGLRNSRRMIELGFFSNILMILLINMVIYMPHPLAFTYSEMYKVVLTSSFRVYLASMVAYLAGELLNAIILIRIKKYTKGRFLWIRTLFSTIVGQIFDTTIFIFISFIGLYDFRIVMNMIIWQFTFKIIIEIILLPVTYFLIGYINKRFKYYDCEVQI